CPACAGLWPLSPGEYAVLGAWAAFGFMLGELPNSFVKRQLDIGPGDAAGGGSSARLLQLAIDRLDSGIGMMTAIAVAVPTPPLTLLVDRAAIPGEIWGPVLRAWRALGVSCAIVRSSALGEDSASASFAGQLDSIADVTSEDGLARALRRCWAARWSARVLAYERHRRRPLAGMGVIVQEQIRASLSGVMFTASPGDEASMVVEYCAGAGEALVSGRVNPGRVTLDRASGSIRHTAEPEHGGRLADPCLRDLAGLGLRIEAAFGAPQDIEWTIDETNGVWIVQARPIAAAVAGAHAKTDGASTLWS